MCVCIHTQITLGILLNERVKRGNPLLRAPDPRSPPAGSHISENRNSAPWMSVDPRPGEQEKCSRKWRGVSAFPGSGSLESSRCHSNSFGLCDMRVRKLFAVSNAQPVQARQGVRAAEADGGFLPGRKLAKRIVHKSFIRMLASDSSA